MHAATALEMGTPVVSTDRDFDTVEELERIDPADQVAVERIVHVAR